MKAPSGSARRRARETIFQIAYQADLMGEPVARAWDATRDRAQFSPDQRALVEDVLQVLERRGGEVDEALAKAAEHWEIGRLAATDRSVLRAAVGELLGRPGTPARVVLDEAIEIAKRYGTEESGRFVNGVLDRVARELRPGEL
ncbi:MAG TPA: transcription antitermination factor NusB [Candidatus Eisenbacteria bacterium]